MDKLSKAQKDEYAVSFAALALYDGDAEISSAQITALLEATGNTEVEAFYPIIFANFLTADKISELITSPGGAGGGGGDVGAAGGEAAAEEAEEEEKEEEEEADIGGGVDMFGGGDDGGY
mmetsp:Transcript_22235/g.28381  ORF Transcript_22235/g.28381 Transcript_22235/m.28381 type:complete len:120 (+) Transcript_22235:81-440(+)